MGDINAFFLPMVHGSGLFFFLAGLLADPPMIMLNAGDPDDILDAIERHRCTYMLGLPTMLAHIMARQAVQRRNVDSLRICVAGGDVCLPGQQERFEELFGVPLRSHWSATEAQSTFTYGVRSGPVSRPIPGFEIRLLDSDGRSVSRGTPGQAFMRGPLVALGYWKAPGHWDAFPDGWFPTGDLMQEEEDGHFLFISRVKDLIVRGGSNISRVEVERILTAHPAVRDAGSWEPRTGYLDKKWLASCRLPMGKEITNFSRYFGTSVRNSPTTTFRKSCYRCREFRGTVSERSTGRDCWRCFEQASARD
jgi:acyl-coenzyme A synthetase/AMP-(fatty) acid ligase